jgi:glyoxylase-like metal-dependent hydrolase (beta-lactamase superfamily II)
MTIGYYNINIIETEPYYQDGGTMFGIIPKSLWSKFHQPDEQNKIPLSCRLLLIRGNDRIILVDTGVGNKLSEKKRNIYGIKGTGDKLFLSLKELGLSPDDITDVILTHLHFDHCGGATKYLGNDIITTFPKAKYWIQKEQWDWANMPGKRDQGSYLPENFLPISESDQLQLCQDEFNFLPGIDILVTYGHTPAMQLVKISDENNTLLYAADLIPTAAHIPEIYSMSLTSIPYLLWKKNNRF